ncbi:hypothetical protein NUH16_011158 [Penicillium rubens]|nr:hypothetical protein NUH16_011158 [Penicillium rubens]
MHLFGEEGVQDMEVLAIQEPEVYNHTDPMTTYSQALRGRSTSFSARRNKSTEEKPR